MIVTEYSIDKLSITDCRSLIDMSNFVVILGSYISTWAPSNLLSGQQFSHQLYELIFKNNKNEFYEKSIDESFIQFAFQKLPFEVINSKCPNQQVINKILKNCFNPKKPNPIHDLIADLLVSNRLRAVITTNYDRCLETAINNKKKTNSHGMNSKIDIVINEKDVSKFTKSNNPMLFKIHGTIDQESTMIYNLDQEGQLPLWKKKLLLDLINDSNVLLIGYSGLDFDICKEISISKPRTIYWNFYRPSDVTINSRLLEKKVPIVRLFGDMGELLTKMFLPITLTANSNNTNYLQFFRKSFTVEEIILWQSRILNALTYSKAAIPLTKRWLGKNVNTDFTIELMSELGGGLAPNGRYRDAGYVHLKAAKIAKKSKLDLMTYFRQLCCASDAFRGSGNYLLSMILHLKLKTMYSKVKNQSEEMQALIIRNQVLLHQIFFRYLKIFKFKKFYRSIQNYIQSLLQKHSSLLLKSGNYYIFQQMQLWSERYDIDSQYSKDAETNTIPEPEFGYKQLFFNLGMLMDFRFRLRRKKIVDNDDYNLARKYVDDARKLGIIPEIWKLLMLIRDKFPLNFTSADNKLLWATFMSCQYTLLQRFEKILSRG